MAAMIRRYLARRRALAKQRWAVQAVALAHEHTCPGETLSVERLYGVLVWHRSTNHSSGFCYSRQALLYVMSLEVADAS